MYVYPVLMLGSNSATSNYFQDISPISRRKSATQGAGSRNGSNTSVIQQKNPRRELTRTACVLCHEKSCNLTSTMMSSNALMERTQKQKPVTFFLSRLAKGTLFNWCFSWLSCIRGRDDRLLHMRSQQETRSTIFDWCGTCLTSSLTEWRCCKKVHLLRSQTG